MLSDFCGSVPHQILEKMYNKIFAWMNTLCVISLQILFKFNSLRILMLWLLENKIAFIKYCIICTSEFWISKIEINKVYLYACLSFHLPLSSNMTWIIISGGCWITQIADGTENMWRETKEKNWNTAVPAKLTKGRWSKFSMSNM